MISYQSCIILNENEKDCQGDTGTLLQKLLKYDQALKWLI